MSWNGHVMAPHTPTLKYPTPGAFPMGVSLEQEKPPRSRGLLSYLAPGKKERLKFVWGSGEGLFQV